MSDSPPRSVSSKRRRRIAVGLGIGALVLFAAGFFVYRHYTDPRRVRAFAESRLSEAVGGRCTIARASFSFFDGLKLTDVTIGPNDGDPVFTCSEVTATHDPLALLRGAFRLTSVTAVEPTLRIVQDDATDRTNLATLLPHTAPNTLQPGDAPTIELRNAAVLVIRRAAGTERILEELRLTLRARPSPTDPRTYDVVWHDDRDDTSGHSLVELSTGLLRNVTGGLPSMSVEAVMMVVAAKYNDAAAWGDLLGITGRVRATNYNLIESPSAPRSATIRLDDASLSIPADNAEREVLPDQRYLVFHNVRGNAVMMRDEVGAFFEASLHGAACTVKATIRRRGSAWTSLRDVELEGDVKLRSLPIPRGGDDAPVDERRFVHIWPQLVSELHDYDPHGPVDLDLTLSKNAGEDRVQLLDATITARGGDASARWFPYRGQNLRGSVHWSPNGVSIVDICGDHEGGTVCVDGHFERPNKCAPANLNIRADRIPLDEQLLAGLNEQYRRIVEPFGIDVPINATVRLTRGTCTDGEMSPWEWEGDIRAQGATIRHDQLALPLGNASAAIHATRDRIEVRSLSGTLAGADFDLNGQLSFLEEGRHHGLFRANIRSVELSPDLLTVLPDSVTDIVGKFQPGGRLTARLALETQESQALGFTSAELGLEGIDLKIKSFPIPLRSLEGPIEIGPNGATIGPLTGRVGRSSLALEGQAKFDGPTPELDITVKSPDLSVGEAIKQALPSSIRESFAAWNIRDPIDATVRIQTLPPNFEPVFDLTANFSGVTVDHRSLPQPLKDVRGTITAGSEGIRSKELLMQYAEASVVANFSFAPTQDVWEGAVSLRAAGVMLDDDTRSSLPEGLRGAWDRAAPRGALELDLVQLTYRRLDGGAADWSIAVEGALRDVSLTGLVDLDQINGRFSVTGDLFDERGATNLRGNLNVDRLRYSQRDVTNVAAPWSLSRDHQGNFAFTFPDVRAELYGGTVGAQFTATDDDRGPRYSASAMIYGMNLAPWIDAGRRRAPEVLEGSAEFKPSQVRGRVNTTLNLSGEFGDVASRRGAGQVEIREGYIYRLPVLLAILNVVNVALPNEEALHDAEARFYITGDRLALDEIQMQGGPLTLVGSGTVSLRDQAVDLRLYASSATALSHVPLISDIIEGATKNLVELRVTGPISRPAVRPTPFRGVSDELRRLFREKERKPIAPSGS